MPLESVVQQSNFSVREDAEQGELMEVLVLVLVQKSSDTLKQKGKRKWIAIPCSTHHYTLGLVCFVTRTFVGFISGV